MLILIIPVIITTSSNINTACIDEIKFFLIIDSNILKYLTQDKWQYNLIKALY